MPIVFSRNKGEESVVAVWKIDESEEELSKIIPFTSEMKSTLDRFRNASRRLEWLASRALIYKITGCIPQVEYNESGQPYIPNLNKNISITHTDGYAAIVVGNCQTGIDIERPLERILRVSERFIHPNEKKYISSEKAIYYNTLIWCAKETLYKIIAQQGVIFNEELEVLPFSIENEGVLNTEISVGKDTTYQLFYIRCADYFLVWHY